jgi:hypothetical protein
MKHRIQRDDVVLGSTKKLPEPKLHTFCIPGIVHNFRILYHEALVRDAQCGFRRT